MQVRRRLRINSVVSAITALIILLILSLAFYRLNNETDKGRIAGEIIVDSFERVSLRNDYMWNKNERAKEQWFAKHEQVGRLLKSAPETFRKPEDIKTLAEMLKDHESIGKVFTGIVKNREKAGSHAYSADLSREIENRLLSQLNMRGYEFVINARRLLESSREARVSAFRLAGTGIVFVFVILGATTLINSRMMSRTITERIRRLRDGALVIGGGNLDHEIDVTGDDEFAELSGTLNEMTAKLRGSYHDLENEIKERKQAEEVQGRLAAIVESAEDAIISKDLNGIIQTWNTGAENIFGYRAEEVIGKHVSLLVPPGHTDEVPSTLARIRHGEHIENFETVYMRKDGTLIPVSLTFSAVKDANGRIIGASKIAHDITERKRTEEVIVQLNRDLAASNSELVTANRELEAFSYSVSHDLRAPLRHISSYMELLKKSMGSQAGDKAKHYMSVIAGASKKMGMLIDDLLAFSRIGRADMKKTAVNIPGLIRDITREMAADIKERDVEWKIGTLPDVYGDTNMLRLAIVNLISNAIKYTAPRSRAEIEIGCTEEADEFIFFVKDNGVGFDMKYGDKLFGVFQRLHKEDEFEGTGIGLANVRQIISRHGGRTWAEGAVGQGAVFYFTIPKIKEISVCQS